MPLSPEQLEQRKSGIGSSEVAAAVGLSPYDSPLDLWAKKVGLVQTVETDAMRLGTLMEPVVLDFYAREQQPVTPWKGGTLVHPLYPWMMATPDAIGACEAIVECKTAGSRQRDQWGDGADEVPVQYLLQVQWQMAITGRDRCHIAVLFRDDVQLRVYRLERDDELIAMLIKKVSVFWQSVLDRKPPLELAERADKSTLAALAAAAGPRVEPLGAEAFSLAISLAEARKAKREAVKEEERLSKLVQAMLVRRGVTGMTDGTHRITWNANASGGTDWKAVAEEAGVAGAIIAKHQRAGARVLKLHGFEDE